VRYQSTAPPTIPTTTTTTVAPPPPPPPPPITTTAPPIQKSSVRATVVETVTPATAPVAPVPTNGEEGQATWYAAAPAGMCASPTLPFGTVLTVTNLATGASTTCTVDDREQAGYPRVVDLSPSGFAQLADPSQGVVDVTISW
jgi:rare lipoprotein A (peptidoglycan hydrolase)